MRNLLCIVIFLISNMSFAKTYVVDCKPSPSTPYSEAALISGELEMDESSDRIEGSLDISLPHIDTEFKSLKVSGTYSDYSFDRYLMEMYHSDSDRDFYTKISLDTIFALNMKLIYNFVIYNCRPQ